MAYQSKLDDKIYVTADEFDSFVELLRESYKNVHVVNNRSQRYVYFDLDCGVSVKFTLTGLFVDSRGLMCYSTNSHHDCLRYGSYWGDCMNLTGKGSRDRGNWKEAEMVHSMMFSPVEGGETKITLEK